VRISVRKAFLKLLSLALTAAGLQGCFSDRSSGNVQPVNPLQSAPATPSSPTLFPSGANVEINKSRTFVVAGGTAPYTFEVTSGSGSINSSGVYTASGTPGTEFIKVTDATGKSYQAVVVVYVTLAITPSAPRLIVGASTTFAGQFGMGTYTYSLTSGSGTLNSNTGAYTAPGAPGTATVRVTDSEGNTANASITIASPVTISPTARNLLVHGNQTFTSSGGFNPKTFTIRSGGGSIGAGTGAFTAPGLPSATVVRVTDSAGNFAEATVTTAADLTISPTARNLLTNANQAFSASGGFNPKTFSIQSGGGSIDSTTGDFTAPATPGTTVVRVTDNEGNFVQATVVTAAALTISPTTQNLIVDTNQAFSSAGGFNPKVYSIQSGGGSIVTGTGVFTAPTTAGTTVVRVTDSVGNFTEATVTTAPALTITPPEKNLLVNASQTFGSVGGFNPKTFSILSGGGVINATTGAFTAPATADTTVVRVTDSEGNFVQATVVTEAALTISPSARNLIVNANQTFSSTGGFSPKVYSIRSGGGSIIAGTGVFTAPSTPDTTVVRVTDNEGNFVEATLITAATLTLSPHSKNMTVGNSQSFVGSGGFTPYTYSVVAPGAGTINSGTGLYTAPGSVGPNETIRVTDSEGNTASATITLFTQLALTPNAPLTLASMNTQTFDATGGVPPLTFEVVSGPGLVTPVDADTATFTAGSTSGTAVFRVADSNSNSISLNISVNAPAQVVAGGGFACVRFTNGRVKCWGRNNLGQLGTGTSVGAFANMGDAANEMGSNLPFVDLGTNRTATQISAGEESVCALLDNGTTKCWGGNSRGQLGLDLATTINKGDASGEMGDFLPAVDFGSSGDATNIFLGATNACAVLADGNGKCWGRNQSGQSGVNSTTQYGDAPGETSSLPVVSLGADFPTLFALGGRDSTVGHTCARVASGRVRCWGSNASGQIGLGLSSDFPTADVGDSSEEMTTYNNYVDLGATQTVTALSAGTSHTCAILTGGTVKCWGLNSSGQLGQGDTADRGHSLDQMGTNLLALDFGDGQTVTKIASGFNTNCAILSNNALKCWGANTNGVLGIGSATGADVSRGDASDEMGTNLAATNLGSDGAYAIDIALGREYATTQPFVCAILNNRGVKCWGSNGSGQLGRGDTLNRGENADEMGDHLPYVPL
jgi:alpha-tubulin suppressor-like RCC1 family protein